MQSQRLLASLFVLAALSAALFLPAACRSGSEPAKPAGSPPAQSASPAVAARPAQAKAAGGPTIDLHLLERKQGPRLAEAVVRQGSVVVVGGYLRGLTPNKADSASFRLRFAVRAGARKVGGFDGPVNAPFDLPAERAVRVDVGLPLPADAPLGPGVVEFEVQEPGRASLKASYPFTVAPAPPPAE